MLGIPNKNYIEEISLSVDNLIGTFLLDVLSLKGIPCALEITSKGHLFRFYPRSEKEKEEVRSALSFLERKKIGWVKRFLFPEDFLNWKKYFKPVHFKKVVVKPPWEKVRTRKKIVVISPALAFGTGNHPSTKLAISLIEEQIQGGERVLDIGTGSGILSIVALKLGAREAIAIDKDSSAIENAILNARLNDVTKRLKVEKREAEELKEGDYDMLLANLDSFQLKKLAKNLLSFNFKYLIISGLKVEESREVRKVYKNYGFKEKKSLREEGWQAILYTR